MRTRSLAFLVMFIASSLPAQQRASAGNVSLTIPNGWRAATRAELANGGDPPPLLALLGPGNATIAVLRAPLPAEARDASPMQVAGTAMMDLLLHLNGGSVETPLHATTLAGVPAAEWVASYATAKPDDSRARVVCVVRDGAQYTVVASGPAEERNEIDAIVKSFSFGK